MTEIEASAIETLIESMIGTNLTGTLEIKENNTYVTTFWGGFDDGTWSINSAGDKITIDAGTVDEMVINNISITDNTLIASMDFVESVDLGNDAQTPDVDINISTQLTFTK